jgi:heme-binding protein
MSRRLKQGAVVFLVAIAAAQVVRPDRTNPPTDTSRTITAHASSEVAAVLDRACGDCHSNATEWRWYAQVAPLSWLMASGVAKGRSAVNFSDWAGYSPDQQKLLLTVSCDDVRSGKMPGAYALLRPETRLSARDVETICAAARQADARPAAGF